MYRSVDQRREFGVPDGPFTGAHVIDVDRLSSRDRAELAERLRSSTPILATRGSEVVPWAAATLLLSLAAVVGLALCQLGRLHGWMAMQSEWPWPVLYGAIGAIGGVSAVRLATAVRFAGWQPLPQGTFLFPLDLLVVTGRRVHVTPFGDARVAVFDENARSVVLTYADGHSVTVSGERESKASLLSELLAAQRSLEDGTLAGSSGVDVLASIRSAGWEAVEAKGEPRGGALSPRIAALVLVAPVGAALALGVWDRRERASDEALFQNARSVNTSEAYVDYLTVATFHEAEVRQHWLPAAMRREAGDSIVLLDRFVRNFFPSAEVELGKANLHQACETYALGSVPPSPPTQFGRDGTALPPTVATHGTMPVRPDAVVSTAWGDRLPTEICGAEVARARLDDVIRLQEPVRLWTYMHAESDPQRVAEARAAAETALDALVAAVRTNATDPEARAELVALLEVARRAERPAVVLVDDATTLPRSQFNLSLRGAIRFVFSRNVGEAVPDATWTFTKSRRSNVTVVMARGETRIDRTFALEGKGDTVMGAFLDRVCGWSAETGGRRTY